MDISPDTKDWTWVLDRACPECGFDTREVERQGVAPLVRSLTGRWVEVLQGGEGVRVRPVPTVWSPLEYGCHVRDVFRIFDERLRLMLTQDDPLFLNWDQNETALAERYGEQDPLEVAQALRTAGESLAARFESVTGDQWERPGRRSDGAAFTVETFGRYLLHDPVHHLYDIVAS
jgi:hypothetical protein